jgi:hypothetical protein
MRFTSFFMEFELTKEELCIILGFGYMFMIAWNYRAYQAVDTRCVGRMICEE